MEENWSKFAVQITVPPRKLPFRALRKSRRQRFLISYQLYGCSRTRWTSFVHIVFESGMNFDCSTRPTYWPTSQDLGTASRVETAS